MLTEEQVLEVLEGSVLFLGGYIDRSRDSDKNDKSDKNAGCFAESDADVTGVSPDMYSNNVTFDE